MEQAIAESFSQIILLIAIISIIPAILSIILFFKIWAMTNNVKDIKETLEDWIDLEHPQIEDADKTSITKF